MSAFKVGQRVRIVGGKDGLVGLEATITAIPNPHYPNGSSDKDCRIAIDGLPCCVSAASDGTWSAVFYNLAPLTPPQADADSWAADKVREVTKPRYEPIRTKERA